MTTPAPPRLRRKRPPRDVPVTGDSLVLFRLGEQCNNACPMCSNSGRPEAFFTPTPELLRRVDFLAGAGFARVVLTGGEPTIHPGLWEVVARLRERGMRWDLNTHGRSFAAAGLAARAAAEGLERAIVSLHSHRPEISAAIFGTSERAHAETVAGLRALAATPVALMINVVLTRPNLDHVAEHLAWCLDTFGPAVALKVCFPWTGGKGGGWEGIDLRLDEVTPVLRALPALVRGRGGTLHFEGVPNCVLGDPTEASMGRSGFGETHYLEDVRGERVFSMREIETALAVYPDACRDCAALAVCPGVSEPYARRHGVDELRPFAAVLDEP